MYRQCQFCHALEDDQHSAFCKYKGSVNGNEGHDDWDARHPETLREPQVIAQRAGYDPKFRPGSNPDNLQEAPAEPSAEEWHTPGLGEVHNRDRSLVIYCEKSVPEDISLSGYVVDEALAKRVAAALAVTAAGSAEPSAGVLPVLPGWKLVPIEPTKVMLVLGENALHRASHGDFVATEGELESMYRAMLDAAPSHPQDAPQPASARDNQG